ncbi:MAG: 50S ribosomal protein L18 [Kiritimatiellae bacterium]|nr:50S ribosomal protein L18 [Kiritimatiellia bacterium]
MSFNRKAQRKIRHMRLRQKVKGTADRPRMAICVTNQHMYVQFIDDDAMTTLASASSLKDNANANKAEAKVVGERAAEAAKAKGISLVVVDRGGFKFHGRVKEIVDSAVAAGLKISEKPPKPPKEKKAEPKKDEPAKKAKKPAKETK